MITFNNSHEFLFESIDRSERTVSTLLIPESLVAGFLENRLKEHGNNTAVYLRNLLRMYRILAYSGMIPGPRKIKTEYQEEGLNLKRVSFRPDNADWIELGELGIGFGKSRCWLFAFLLQLDIDGLSDILSRFFNYKSVPTTPELEVKSSWTLQRYFHDFTRSFHVNV